MGAVGIAATVVVGVWSIVLAVRFRYPGKLSLIADQPIELFSDIARNLPGLSISYNDEPVESSLRLLKATVINVGRKDLAAGGASSPIRISLPAGCAWVESQGTNASDGVTAVISINAEVLELRFDLLRRGEYVSFDALLNVAEPVEPRKKRGFLHGVSVNHRIADTEPVKFEEPPASVRYARTQMFIFLGLLALLVAGFISGIAAPNPAVLYRIPYGNSSVAAYPVPENGETVRLYTADRQYVGTASFAQLSLYTPVRGNRPVPQGFLLLNFILIAATAGFAVFYFTRYISAIRMREVLRPAGYV